MNLKNIEPFTYDREFLYNKWQELIYNISYDWQTTTFSDKWFHLLDEYYTKSTNYFSTWSRVQNSIKALTEFCNETRKISINNEDLLALASFFAYVDFDVTNCDNFVDSAILVDKFCEDVGIGNQDNKVMYSLLSSLDYHNVFDEENNIMYHAFRDINFIWTGLEYDQYSRLIGFMKNEFPMSEDLWCRFRKLIAEEMLGGHPVMHTDYFFYLCAEQVQNNLLDEIQIYSEIKV
jgi:predicted metal-dependent HD superfamily phosphohydrolase